MSQRYKPAPQNSRLSEVVQRIRNFCRRCFGLQTRAGDSKLDDSVRRVEMNLSDSAASTPQTSSDLQRDRSVISMKQAHNQSEAPQSKAQQLHEVSQVSNVDEAVSFLSNKFSMMHQLMIVQEND